MNKTHPFPSFTPELRKKAKDSLQLAATWHNNVQIKQEWPHWKADSGRFSSTHCLHGDKKDMMSICWNTARGAQACMSAYQVLGDQSILDTATNALEYVKICQLFEPEFPQHYGAFLEESPQADHISTRDSIEALQAFTNAYIITKDPLYLQRAVVGADWWCGWFIDNAFPHGYVWHKYKNDTLGICNDFSRIMLGAAALVFCQLDTILGNTKYTRHLSTLLDGVIENNLKKDGSLKMNDGTDVGHHALKTGAHANCFTNDDGFVVALMAAYRYSGNERYKEAALRNAHWWLGVDVLTQPYASAPAILLNLIDFYRFTGNNDFLIKAEGYINHILTLQITESDDIYALGGFRGHDSSNKKEIAYFNDTHSNEIVSLRTSIYAMIALSKVAAENDSQWNLAYSAFGW